MYFLMQTEKLSESLSFTITSYLLLIRKTGREELILCFGFQDMVSPLGLIFPKIYTKSQNSLLSLKVRKINYLN